MRVTGIVLRLAYCLTNHAWASWPLSRWLGFTLAGGALAVLVSAWPQFWISMFLGIAYLSYLMVLTWAGRQGYVRFEVIPRAQLSDWNVPVAPLQKEETIPIRASGWFNVEGRDRYLVDIEADFETVGTREHIVLGRILPSRFLVLGRWPADELGWWYIFFQPTMIRKLEIGQFVFGSQSRLAIQVEYEASEESTETIYLIVDRLPALRRVWDDLVKDAPLEAKD